MRNTCQRFCASVSRHTCVLTLDLARDIPTGDRVIARAPSGSGAPMTEREVKGRVAVLGHFQTLCAGRPRGAGLAGRLALPACRCRNVGVACRKQWVRRTGVGIRFRRLGAVGRRWAPRLYGPKRTTPGLANASEIEPEPVPRIGDQSVVVGGDCKPLAVVQTETRLGPLLSVDIAPRIGDSSSADRRYDADAMRRARQVRADWHRGAESGSAMPRRGPKDPPSGRTAAAPRLSHLRWAGSGGDGLT